LKFLGNRLDALSVVAEEPKDDGRIYFGCTVTLEDENGDCVSYRIVGPDEWDSKRGEISIESPVARALLGKQAGDDVEVQRPGGHSCFLIIKVAVSSE